MEIHMKYKTKIIKEKQEWKNFKHNSCLINIGVMNRKTPENDTKKILLAKTESFKHNFSAPYLEK